MKPPEINDKSDAVLQFQRFYEIVKILRKKCPWDAKQTNESIARLTIEEVYECNEEIYKKNDAGFAKELGDLLLHIVLHTVIAEERGTFDMAKVIDNESNKMIHRHPHVFGDVEVSGTKEVLDNWEALKKTEQKEENKKSILDGVPIAMPQLLRAERMQHKTARVGFDWDDKSEVWEKVFEEIAELREELRSGNKQKANEEFGDVLFALVNAARHEDIAAEDALRITNNKFADRFKYIEEKTAAEGKDMKKMSLEELDEIWEEAKIELRKDNENK